MPSIMVQMSEAEWTEQAMHLACPIAYESQLPIALLWLIPVPNPAWLGADPNEVIPKPREHAISARQEAYAEIAKDYGLNFTIQRMHYFTLSDALVEAADLLDAQVVFAQAPKSLIPYWDRLILWNLERRLAAHKRQLYHFKPVIYEQSPISSSRDKSGIA